MFFDILKSDKSVLANEIELYEHCIECEKKVRTEPNTAIAKARTAVEVFINVILKINGVEIPKDKEERKAAGLAAIYDKISYCSARGYINEKVVKGIDFARKEGNQIVHVTGEERYTAPEIFKALYLAIASYATGETMYKMFENEKRNEYVRNGKIVPEIPGYETEDMLPIGDYEVIRPMFDFRKADTDSIRTYRCKRISIMEGKEEVQYAIVRRFMKDSDEDIRQYRDIMAMNEIKRNYANLDKPPILAEEISTSPDCEYRYLCYMTAKDTFLLSHKESYKKFLRELKCETVEQQIYIKLKIVKEIVEILHDLIGIDEDRSIHHRNLRPHCVFITPSRKGGCRVSIGNFEYSKVAVGDGAATANVTLMVSDYAQSVQNDPYAAPEIKRIEERLLTDPDWEQADIYSVAKLSLYVIFGNADEKNLASQMEEIQCVMSDEFYRVTRDIIEKPYPTRPTLKDYLKAIKTEMLRFE